MSVERLFSSAGRFFTKGRRAMRMSTLRDYVTVVISRGLYLYRPVHDEEDEDDEEVPMLQRLAEDDVESDDAEDGTTAEQTDASPVSST